MHILVLLKRGALSATMRLAIQAPAPQPESGFFFSFS
jgi:hypothetical protein